MNFYAHSIFGDAKTKGLLLYAQLRNRKCTQCSVSEICQRWTLRYTSHTQTTAFIAHSPTLRWTQDAFIVTHLSHRDELRPQTHACPYSLLLAHHVLCYIYFCLLRRGCWPHQGAVSHAGLSICEKTDHFKLLHAPSYYTSWTTHLSAEAGHTNCGTLPKTVEQQHSEYRQLVAIQVMSKTLQAKRRIKNACLLNCIKCMNIVNSFVSSFQMHVLAEPTPSHHGCEALWSHVSNEQRNL